MATKSEVQLFDALLDKWLDQDKAKATVLRARERNIVQDSLSGLGIQVTEEVNVEWPKMEEIKPPLAWPSVLSSIKEEGNRLEKAWEAEDLSWLDIWVKSWKLLQQAGKKLKVKSKFELLPAWESRTLWEYI